MNRCTLDDAERATLGPGVERVDLGESLATTAVACNWYRIAPEESLPGGLHAHVDQEELFYVVEGEATFETLDGVVTVTTGEAVRFAPGTFQSGRNAGDETLVVLAVGAPRATDDVRIPFPCPTCDDSTLRLDTEDGLTFGCPACGVDHDPDPCPECASEELRATVGDAGRPVVACDGCGATFDAPPVSA
ncbi:cupin domain-containing protein [Halogranum gelatinilyticum]|uniref:cupin domain-containing protein n=1 Tax=Halogranum gelatinilyticum TaxID=660521 RepID=UPI001FCD6408|nr:cupin domain-containing protein [Halogranum gelatinilyticum]